MVVLREKLYIHNTSKQTFVGYRSPDYIPILKQVYGEDNKSEWSCVGEIREIEGEIKVRGNMEVAVQCGIVVKENNGVTHFTLPERNFIERLIYLLRGY